MTNPEGSGDTSLMKILGALKKPKEKERKAGQEDPAGPEQTTVGGDTGDLSDLIKKINESAQETLQPPQGIPPQSALQEPESMKQESNPPLSPDVPVSLGNAPPSPDVNKSVGATGSVPGMSALDVRESLGKIMAEIGSKAPLPEEKPSPSPPIEFDIFDEPEKTSLPHPVQPSAADTPPSSGKVAGTIGTTPNTESDEKIISVDQISDLSELILPKGATFKIEELKLHGRVNVFEGKGTGSLPPEINEIWHREFSNSGFKDLDFEGDVLSDTQSRMAPFKKFGLSTLFKGIRSDQEQYNTKIHGPLVDLAFQPKPGIEE
ncbi:MAG: hypothetical protein NTW33_04965, partial [Methanoregula sp.]|nr:hypothetical protein [Methanoregula sp.]